VRHPRHRTYRAFIDQCANILTARPFFRERDETFKAHISGALKAKDPSRSRGSRSTGTSSSSS
jgi:hypothetical protein